MDRKRRREKLLTGKDERFVACSVMRGQSSACVGLGAPQHEDRGEGGQQKKEGKTELNLQRK